MASPRTVRGCRPPCHSASRSASPSGSAPRQDIGHGAVREQAARAARPSGACSTVHPALGKPVLGGVAPRPRSAFATASTVIAAPAGPTHATAASARRDRAARPRWARTSALATAAPTRSPVKLPGPSPSTMTSMRGQLRARLGQHPLDQAGQRAARAAARPRGPPPRRPARGGRRPPRPVAEVSIASHIRRLQRRGGPGRRGAPGGIACVGSGTQRAGAFGPLDQQGVTLGEQRLPVEIGGLLRRPAADSSRDGRPAPAGPRSGAPARRSGWWPASRRRARARWRG